MFIIIVFWLGCGRPSGLLFFLPALLLSTLTPLFLSSSSVSLSYYILAVPMRKCLGKYSCMSSPFPIAILNGTFFFRSVKAMNNWKRSAIKQILLLVLLCLRLGCPGSLMSLHGPEWPKYPEWPHRQGGCLACCGCTFESRWCCTDLYCARGAQGVLPLRVWGATSQLDLSSLTLLFVASCGWLQRGVPHWVASGHYCK